VNNVSRKLIVGLVVALVFGSVVSAGPATAKKNRKPVSFEAEGSLLLPNPNDFDVVGPSYAGITRTEFESACAVPTQTQGLDAYVIELPAKVTRVDSIVYADVTNATGLNQLDFFFFDETCAPLGELLSFQDAQPLMPRGTKFVLVRNWFSDSTDFVFYANEAR
jgi:hypothetical protein